MQCDTLLPEQPGAPMRERDYTMVMQMAVTTEPDRASLANALRELEAARARVERDARSVTDEMRKQLVEKLLPVLDNLDRTIACAEQAGNARAVVEGVQLVRAQLEGVLRGYGLERIDALDCEFDPAIHDAVATLPVPSPALHEVVLEQHAPAYLFNGTLLRPARVVVGMLRT
jgi:molecular chaperone GrpE